MMRKKRNSKYWHGDLFDSVGYIKDWHKKHPGYNARSQERFKKKHFYSKGLTSRGKKRKV